MRVKWIKQSHAETFLRWLLCGVDRMCDSRRRTDGDLSQGATTDSRWNAIRDFFFWTDLAMWKKGNIAPLRSLYDSPGGRLLEENQLCIQVQSHFVHHWYASLQLFFCGLFIYIILVKRVLDASCIVNKIIINLEQLHYYIELLLRHVSSACIWL